MNKEGTRSFSYDELKRILMNVHIHTAISMDSVHYRKNPKRELKELKKDIEIFLDTQWEKKSIKKEVG